jgi:NAD(P)-dependent dehydrogenase (short-subunit alcohol dehydrogenase family)
MKPRPEFEGAWYRPAGKLEGKALITGGDSGIGRSVAYLFAREGADVAIVCLEEERTDALEVRDEIAKLGRRALVIYGDVSDAAFCARAVSAA